MQVLTWLIRGFLLFTLFAFALNNQQSATVHWFFGAQWQAPMVIIVLAAFSLGCALGVVAMLPSWWRRRKAPAAPVNTSPGQPAGETASASVAPPSS